MVLLETPSGFAMFLVKEFAFQEEKKNIWVLFSDPEYAIQVLVALAFRKIDNRSIARDCNDDGPGKVLRQLIEKYCKAGEELIVQDKHLKASIESNLGITCICDGPVVGELMWGIKNVLHKFVREEACNITREYCLPGSEGLQEALPHYLVNLPPTRLNRSFISKFGLLCYHDLNLETFPQELSRSFDKYVGIGEAVKDGLDYAKVLALVLVPELVKKYGFSKTFSPELASKLQQAKEHTDKSGYDLTMANIEMIMGILNYLLDAPEKRDKILMRVKLMERAIFRSHHLELINETRSKRGLDAVQRAESRVDFNNMKYRRVLLKTPSGFAIFNVRENVFSRPQNIWKHFTDIIDARNIVFALGFARVDNHNVACDSVIGPGDELRQLILRFNKANEELVVQDTELKDVIESKLDVKCWTGDEAVDELFWGLKHVLLDFIPEEKDKITRDYYFPASKQLQKDLETYKINVSMPKINLDWDLLYEFGHLNILDTLLKIISKDLHDMCDQDVSSIGGSGDDMLYASTIAKVLIPEHVTEIELSKIADSLRSKLIDVPKHAEKAISKCDKTAVVQCISKCDKTAILQCLERLLLAYKQRSFVEQHLNELLLKMMTLEGETDVSGTAVSREDDKQLTVADGRGKDETPAVGRVSCNGKNVDSTKKDEELSVEAVGKEDGTHS